MKTIKQIVIAGLFALATLLSAIVPAHANTVQADVLQAQILAAMQAKDYAAADKLFGEYDQLGVDMPPPLQLQRGVVYARLNRFYRAELEITAALNGMERGSADYNTAVQLLAKIAPKAAADTAGKAEAAKAAEAALTPKCNTPTKSGDAACYLPVANHAGCYAWNPVPATNERVTWSGQCRGGVPDGEGEIVWSGQDGKLTSAKGRGRFVDGVRQGHWINRNSSDRIVSKGPYVDGKRHGHWELPIPFVKSGVRTGPFVDGKQHGQWVYRDGESVSEGPYVDGKRHGHWVSRYSEGHTFCHEYLYGEIVDTNKC